MDPSTQSSGWAWAVKWVQRENVNLPLGVLAVLDKEAALGKMTIQPKHAVRNRYEAAYYFEVSAAASTRDKPADAWALAAVARATLTGLSPHFAFFRRRRDRFYLELVIARAELQLGEGAGDFFQTWLEPLSHWTDRTVDRIFGRPNAIEIARRLLQPPE